MSNEPDASSLYSIKYLPFTLCASIGPDFRTHIVCRNASLEGAEFFGTIGPLQYCEIIEAVAV